MYALEQWDDGTQKWLRLGVYHNPQTPNDRIDKDRLDRVRVRALTRAEKAELKKKA